MPPASRPVAPPPVPLPPKKIDADPCKAAPVPQRPAPRTPPRGGQPTRTKGKAEQERLCKGPVKEGQTVYVAEYGHGARKGVAIRCLRQGDADRVMVRFPDQTVERKCFAGSVFLKEADAERAAQ
jgi:hypothetical protein